MLSGNPSRRERPATLTDIRKRERSELAVHLFTVKGIRESKAPESPSLRETLEWFRRHVNKSDAKRNIRTRDYFAARRTTRNDTRSCTPS